MNLCSTGRFPGEEPSFLPWKKPGLGGCGSPPNLRGTLTGPGSHHCSDTLHIYVGALRLNGYFKKKDPFIFKRRRLIAASRAFLHSWLPLGLRNKFFTNTSLLLKNGIHHKPSREEAEFDGHNTIIQPTVSFLFNSICRGVNISEKTHTKALVNINQKGTAPFPTQLPITGHSR